MVFYPYINKYIAQLLRECYTHKYDSLSIMREAVLQ